MDHAHGNGTDDERTTNGYGWMMNEKYLINQLDLYPLSSMINLIPVSAFCLIRSEIRPLLDQK